MRGRFITFEGGEGVGKTTQIPLLAERLTRLGLAVMTTREPGGSPMAERIRELLVTGAPQGLTPMAELLLMQAARAQHVAETIRPHLEAGAWVLCDRFYDSTTVYQGHARAMNLERIALLNQWATDGLVPDLTIVLTIDPETGIGRSTRRGGVENRFEQEAMTFHRAVHEGFLRLAQSEPERFVVLEAERSIPDVAEAVWEAVERVYSRI